ncbi:MAG: methionyl-tRNA formyltransferase, partial [Verrucomicrobia bacterium]|nr:methionyl-tRNA formyltransferase [Verrucomicrobiota bacterium]
RLAQLGAQLLVETIPDYVAGKLTPLAQPAEGASYARKISKDDGRIDWTQSAQILQNRIRAFTPWPGASTQVCASGKARLLKIWQAEVVDCAEGEPGEIRQANQNGLVVRCGEGALKILQLQLEGGRRLHTSEFLRGHPLAIGEKLGS